MQDAQGHRDRGARMTGPEGVVLAFGGIEERSQPFRLPKRLHSIESTGENLVGVRLVAHIEDDRIGRRLEYPMQRDDELDRPERSAEVAADFPADGDDLAPQLFAERRQSLLGAGPDRGERSERAQPRA